MENMEDNLNTSHVKVKPWPFMALFKYIII